MIHAPVTTFDRIEYLRKHCEGFKLTIDADGYQLYANAGDGNDYASAGPFGDLADTIDDALYALMPHI